MSRTGAKHVPVNSIEFSWNNEDDGPSLERSTDLLDTLGDLDNSTGA